MKGVNTFKMDVEDRLVFGAPQQRLTSYRDPSTQRRTPWPCFWSRTQLPSYWSPLLQNKSVALGIKPHFESECNSNKLILFKFSKDI